MNKLILINLILEENVLNYLYRTLSKALFSIQTVTVVLKNG